MELGFLPESIINSWPEDDYSSRKLAPLVGYTPRPFSCLEIELTTRCNLFCPSCPRVAFRQSWINEDMPLDYFYKIYPAFDLFEAVLFRGWGEPLLNPFFPEMVRLAYQSGGRLVLATNGVELVNLDLMPYFEAIIFRLDYGRASTYERRNPGVKFNRTIFNVSQVLHWRETNQTDRPAVLIQFAKNRYSLNELATYLDTAVRLNPDRVVFYQPGFHVRRIDAAAQLPGDMDQDLIRRVDETLETMARSAYLELINPPVKPDAETICPCDPDRTVFVNRRGRVAPCRNTALPVAHGKFTRFYLGREEPQETVFFGSLLRRPFEEIFKRRDYRHFRRSCRIPEALLHPKPSSPAGPPEGKVVTLGKRRLKSCLCSKQSPAG